jgi:exopolysaccharide biosynthesis polyprenyl glycosylphosphotransferase
MLREHPKSLATVVRLFDLLALAAAWPLAHAALRAVGWAPPGELFPEPPLLGATAALFAWVGSFSIFGLYASRRQGGVPGELAALGKSVLLTAAAGLFGWVAWPSDVAPHPGLGVAVFALAFLLCAAGRVAMRLVAYAVRRRGYNSRHFAVVGSGPAAEALVAQVADQPQWGYAFLGYVREPGEVPDAAGAPVLGRPDDLARLLSEHVIDEIFFAVRPSQLQGIEPAVRLCQEQGVTVRISMDTARAGPARMSVAETDGQALLTFSSTPAGDMALAAKRAFDLLASAVMLLLVSPVLVAIAVAIKRDSPGPVFFRQRRVGLNGREFTFFKFRSMRLDAEAQLAALRAQNEMDGPVFKMRRDPRVTRVGRFLRTTSLDELPQFWNVLRGEMSLVGPRPPLPAEVRQYLPWQRRRLSVKPGITCTWQVSGRNDIDFDRWMHLDLAYIDSWSFWGDVGICLKTIPAVLLSRGAR